MSALAREIPEASKTTQFYAVGDGVAGKNSPQVDDDAGPLPEMR